MNLPERPDKLANLLRTALGLELKSTAGKLNWGLLALVTVIIVAASAVDLVSVIVEAFVPEANTDPTSLLQVLITFGFFFAACMGMVLLDEHWRPKGGRSDGVGE